MNAVVVYDTKFGNTERIARAIAETLGAGETVPVVTTEEAGERDLTGLDLLAVGGPTQGHGMSAPLRTFIDHLPSEAVKDVPTVTFDTRLTWPRFLAGSAAAAAAKTLTKKGARLVAPPESFLVSGSEGPLADGELERAHTWASDVYTKIGDAKTERVVAAP